MLRLRAGKHGLTPHALCLQPNVKPQPEEDGGESVSTPTVTTTGVSNVQVSFPLLWYLLAEQRTVTVSCIDFSNL